MPHHAHVVGVMDAIALVAVRDAQLPHTRAPLCLRAVEDCCQCSLKVMERACCLSSHRPADRRACGDVAVLTSIRA
jgi:hypothetical protein